MRNAPRATDALVGADHQQRRPPATHRVTGDADYDGTPIRSIPRDHATALGHVLRGVATGPAITFEIEGARKNMPRDP